jgi:hypothetical protein
VLSRRKNDGAIAENIHQQVRLAKNKYNLNREKRLVTPKKLGIKQTSQLNLF